MGELRDAMLQYTSTADPTENAARLERMRQAELNGEVDETALSMAHTALGIEADRQAVELTPLSRERIPATQRLGSGGTSHMLNDVMEEDDQRRASQVRIPASLRLGPTPPSIPPALEQNETGLTTSSERVPVTRRLGPIVDSPNGDANVPDGTAPKIVKRKPGHPPGGRKVQDNSGPSTVPGSKRRTVAQTKPSPIRRKVPNQKSNPKPKLAAGTSRARNQAASTTSSDNQPIGTLIPASVRKRMDFWIQSTPGP